MTYESSDILGGRSLENGTSSETSMFFKLTGVATIGLFAWLAWFRGRVVFLKWKETRYKKAMRRRHGIPDEDERPFNVAYAAAMRAREREDEGGSAPGVNGRRPRNALSEGQQNLRQRFNDVGKSYCGDNFILAMADPRGFHSLVAPQVATTSHWRNASVPIVPQIAQAYAQIKQQQQNGVEPDPPNFGARYNSNPPAIHVTDFNREAISSGHAAPSQQSNKQKLQRIIRKRSFDDEDDLEPTKKSRVEGEELMDGDEDAEWAFKRGSKRGLATEDDEGYESTRGDKRPRNISRDKTPEDQVMEDELDADDVTELRSIPRGKKRDRAEAGSTFGGDEDEMEDDQLDGKASRRRKRKMISKRKSDAHVSARGRKRDRDADVEESEDEDVQKLHVSRKKRGKKNGEDEGDGSDVSMSDSQVSRGSYVKGRRIGEEWEVNGVLYKVGINGQRLRQALVKKARNKFPMPKDSQHPDREANLEVFVETWLTESEYKEAKERRELAWQDTPKQSAEPETPGNVHDSPSIKGKNLLWASAAAQESPVPKRRPFRESIATTVGLRIDAFPDASTTSRRRVASAYGPLPQTGIMESPARNGGFRTFSKWEKQDLEAEAMAKMRAKLQEQKASSSDLKSVGLGAPPLAASASAPGPTGSASSFAFAKPADKPGPTLTASFSMGASPSLTGDSKSPPSLSANKPSGETQPSLSSMSSSQSFPALTSSQPDLSKPLSAAPAPSGSSSMTNFFAPKSGSSTAVASITPAPGGAPAAASTKMPFGFNAPTSGFSSAATNPSTTSPFSFGGNLAGKASTSPFSSGAQSDQKNAEPEKPAQSSDNGASLSGRVGGFVPMQPASRSFTAPSTTPGGSPFSFGKPTPLAAEPSKSTSTFGPVVATNEPPKPTSVFGPSTTVSEPIKPVPAFGTSSTPQNGSSTTGSTTSAPVPKFNFGFSKNSTSSPAAGASSGTPEPSKPAPPTFNFNAPKTSGTTPAPIESSSATAAGLKFKFTTSPFGSTNSAGGASNTTAKPTAFSGFANGSNGSGTSNPFSTTATSPNPAPPKSSIFGNVGGGSTTSSAVNAADAPKPPISFGGNATSTTPSTATATGNSQPSPFTFSFGNAPSSSNSTAPSPFGAQPSSTAASSNGGAQSIFGKPSTTTPSTFGFGGNTSTSSAAFGSFGQTGQNQEEKK
ncbi:hypothetical protein PILCRDRAFT_688928 [Piloderma croceum F 1598]|uniref:FHA domain-containing protein n=1 Tax=Piloderma croceum (strain F 1598) TaxID=765440 RepID=A0A0C3F4J6_PILCF|nr:hypothetical protein PILCRDRAFT_688928 [Piloderma croceum F 1598]